MKPYRSAITGYRKSYRTYKLIFATTILMIMLVPLTAMSPLFLHKPHTLRQLANAVSTKQGMSPKLVASIVQVESSGRPSVVSSKSAVGLMQVKTASAQMVGLNYSERDLKCPEKNLIAGTRILKYYISKYGLMEGLSKYSGGAKGYPEKIIRKMGRV